MKLRSDLERITDFDVLLVDIALKMAPPVLIFLGLGTDLSEFLFEDHFLLFLPKPFDMKVANLIHIDFGLDIWDILPDSLHLGPPA